MNIIKFATILFILLSFLFCTNELVYNESVIKKEIKSLIFTDFAIQDSSLAYSAILEIKTSDLLDNIECEKNIGIINSYNNNLTNQMYNHLYGCQRNFELTSVQMPDYIKKTGCSYFKVNFYAIQSYYDIPMMIDLHKEYLEGEISVLFFNNLNVKFVKSDKFRIRAFQYNKEVSIDDDRLESIW